jgi:nucleotide-binding universal stress UspA family protein
MLATEKHGWIQPASILVATDLADIDRLFPVALDRAVETGAHLLLFHVLTPANTILLDPNGLPFYDPKEALCVAEKSLTPYRTQAECAGVSCNILIREGSAAQQISAAARQLSADLLILGAKSHSILGKLLLGSVAEQVLRSVSMPVITIGPEAQWHPREKGQRRTVLHATSLKKGSPKSTTLAFLLASSVNARMILLHVVSAFSSNRIDTSELQRSTEREIRRIIPQDIYCACTTEIEVAAGTPSIEILAAAVNCNADLIVLGVSKASSFQKFARDGTIYRVLAHSPCPVLTILEEESDSRTKDTLAAKEATRLSS